VPLSDGAGIIEAVGDGVQRFAVGDRVMSSFFTNWFGGAHPTPPRAVPDGAGWLVDGTPFDQRGSFDLRSRSSDLRGSFDTAMRCPDRMVGGTGCRPGDTVLTLGTGGVSISAIQFAKALGARVIATTSSSDKFEKLRHSVRMRLLTTARTRTGTSRCVT